MKVAGLKQSDFAMLVLVVAIAMSFAYFIGNSLINTPQSRSVKVETVVPITSDFPPPSSDVFVADYINPTELIEIGNSNNEQPFTDGSN